MGKLKLSLSAAAVAAVMTSAGSASAAVITIPYMSIVTLYFDGGDAAFHEALKVSVNGGSPIATTFDNKTTPLGTPFSLGALAAGATLTFLDHVYNTGLTWSSNDAANSDGISHVAVTPGVTSPYFSGTGSYVGFEDQKGGGDKDFNDIQALVTFTPVPELSTWGMLVAGFGGLGYAAFRRSRKNSLSFVGA